MPVSAAATTSSPALPHWPADRFELPLDHALLDRVIDDQRRHGQHAAPAAHWQLSEQQARASFDGLLKEWVGVTGERRFADLAADDVYARRGGLIDRALDYLHALDSTQQFAQLDLTAMIERNWRVLDWGSAIDALLLQGFGALPSGARLLEIGGGFGRLPEFLHRSGLADFRYINIDAVPASLVRCLQYLRRHCPDRRCHLVLDDRMSLEQLQQRHHWLIIPAWRAPALLQHSQHDCGINIESFQEMDQHQVDAYLALLDQQIRTDGCVYLMNSRKHLFRGEYRYPERWECLLRQTSLRGWSADHPIEIFRKHGVASPQVRAINAARQYFYRQSLSG